MLLFCLYLLAAASIYICGDFLNVDFAVFHDASQGTKFIVSTVMILLTICLLPLALRLFRFQPVMADLQTRKAAALALWGTLRLSCLGVLLLLNTFLYYAFAFESTYGYLAVVVLLCMPFIIPTMSRCNMEVADEAKEETGDNEETDGSHSQL